MSQIIIGKTLAELCNDCTEFLPEVTIIAYEQLKTEEPYSGKGNISFQSIVQEDELDGRKPIGSAQTSADGSFELHVDAAKLTPGLTLHVKLSKLPHQRSEVKKTVQIRVATFTPDRWEEEGMKVTLRLYQDFWCNVIRKLYDAWVICGRIVSCKNSKIPAKGYRVTAMDKDLLNDDNLGTAITDDNGYFRIDYQSLDFKQTFLSFLGLNVETPFNTGGFGPDVYFQVQSPDGDVVFKENREVGMQPDRKDRGHCFCVSLCVPLEGTATSGGWLRIARSLKIPDDRSLHAFDTDGFARNGFALKGVLAMQGNVPPTSSLETLTGNPYEYRFLVSTTVTAANAITASRTYIDQSHFSPNVIDGTSPYFQRVLLGTLTSNLSNDSVDVYLEQSFIKADGWVNLLECIRKTFQNDPNLDENDLNTGSWAWDSEFLMGIDSAKISSDMSPRVTTPTVNTPGDAIAQPMPRQKIAIRFEMREVISEGVYQTPPQSGTTLNSVYISNADPVLKMDLVDNRTNLCSPVSGNIGVAYTVHHPHLRSASITLRKSGGPTFTLTDGARLPQNDILPTGTATINNANLGINHGANNISLSRCTYMLDLHVSLRRLIGDSIETPEPFPAQAFFYEV
ncbi:MAG TPA: hypothetical protein DCE41_21625 [Cytophagales bacterium]|nr:hypothetical protein [Cytophagales bacterium]